MQRGSLYFVCLAVCCLHTASEPLRIPEDYHPNAVRRRRSDEKDGLALSREIFRNITKKLRENIRRESATDKTDHLQNKVEESRRYVPYHHHEYHWGPYFEEKNVTQISVHVGAEALFNCRVVMLKDKTVMWLSNKTDTAQLLTVGPTLYAGDNRLALKYQYPNNWRLSINPLKWEDAGVYMCQISTHPPRIIYVNLTVLPPIITINGDQSHSMKELFIKKGSSIKLSCIISEDYISNLPLTSPTSTPSTTTSTKPTTTTTELTTRISTVFNRIDLVMNKSWSVETTTITSTVSISTNTKKTTERPTTTAMATILPTDPQIVNNIYGLMWTKQGIEMLENISKRNVSSTISIASASPTDSAAYTCHLQNHSQVTVIVHVVTGENQAAVHHDTWNKGALFWQPKNLSLVYLTALLILTT